MNSKSMIPYDYQIDLSELAYATLKVNYMVYLAMEERTGKTLTAILAADKCDIKTVLVITQKTAIKGWNETLEAYDHKKRYTVTNYHQAHKQPKHDLVILDEAHNYISAFPKAGKIWKELRKLCAQVPLMYLSATPHAQGPQMLYHQFALSSWSPWTKYPNFYSWFKTFGFPYQLEINGIKINQYDKCDQAFVLACTEHLFITKTRKELDFEHEPEDHVHMIALSAKTKAIYNTLLEHNIVDLDEGLLVCDTTSKLRFSLHMLEGGTCKIEDDRIVLANTEKIDHILQVFGDSKDLVIMYNYIAERVKLEKYFKKATILQATSYAEGIDLSMHADLVIYSQDFRTAKHTQRRARQANKNRDTPIIVHFLLVNKGISAQVYKTVSKNKRNFVDSVFERNTL